MQMTDRQQKNPWSCFDFEISFFIFENNPANFSSTCEMSDDDFRTDSLNLRSKNKLQLKTEKDAEQTTLLVEFKWKGSNFVDKVKEQVLF
jgi:hypothetical protein